MVDQRRHHGEWPPLLSWGLLLNAVCGEEDRMKSERETTKPSDLLLFVLQTSLGKRGRERNRERKREIEKHGTRII